MAHAFAGTKAHGIERFAKAFAAAGFVVLVHDHTRAQGATPRESGGDETLGCAVSALRLSPNSDFSAA
jgi:alpha-beta hydrolase superfamily lysophospholipase